VVARKPHRLQIETRRLYRSISTSVFPQMSFNRLAILLRLKNYFTKWLLLHRFKWILSTILNYFRTNSFGIYCIFSKFVSFLVGVNVLFFHVFYRWLFFFNFFIFTLFQYSFLILIIKNVIYTYHIVPRRGTLKRFKNGGYMPVDFFKLIYLIEIIYFYINLIKTLEEIVLYN